jgi:bifunctional ADP-heptose synthase (sugar kinase/adenylyltransferase)
VTPERLEEILTGFDRAGLLVVGDLFLDKYLMVDPALAETSLETGLEAHQVVEIRAGPVPPGP